jgi:hypothetical protein
MTSRTVRRASHISFRREMRHVFNEMPKTADATRPTTANDTPTLVAMAVPRNRLRRPIAEACCRDRRRARVCRRGIVRTWC